MEVFGWFEYGLMASYGPPSSANPFSLFAEEGEPWCVESVSFSVCVCDTSITSAEGWIIGESNGFSFMDPTNANVSQFIRTLSLHFSHVHTLTHTHSHSLQSLISGNFLSHIFRYLPISLYISLSHSLSPSFILIIHSSISLLPPPESPESSL